MENKKLYCSKCILDSTFPGVTIDPMEKLCNYCKRSQTNEKQAIEESQKKIDLTLTSIRGRSYDLVVALSGGKDSCYTMYQIHKRFPDIRMLGVLVDNGFISDIAKQNALNVVKCTKSKLKIINLGGKALNELFKGVSVKMVFPKKTIERATPICVTCSGLFKQILFREAVDNGCPAVAFGWTTGQSFNPLLKMNGKMLLWSKNSLEETLKKITSSEKILSALPPNSLYEEFTGELLLLHPLCVWQYDEERNIKELQKNAGWKIPPIDDPNSTNCLLNSFAVAAHIKKYGYHPYALEIAGLVRCGSISRGEGFRRLSIRGDEALMKRIAKKLKMEAFL